MTEAWPFIGRDKEIEAIADHLSSGRGVLVSGAAGAGKSRLVTAVVEHLTALPRPGRDRRPWIVVKVVAFRVSAGIPMAALSGVLGPDAGDGSSALNRVRTAFHGMATRGPVLLAVDDVQWLDDASALLVHQLVAAGELTMLATLRTGEPVPEPITHVWKDRLVERVELEPLSLESVRSVLEAVFGGHVAASSVARLVERSGGNALFLREFIEDAIRTDAAVFDNGVWSLPTVPVGARLAELVAARLAGLGEAEREAMAVVSLGAGLGLDVLGTVASTDTLEALERRGLVSVIPEGPWLTVAPAHPLYGEVVRSELPELRRRRLIRALADAVEAHPVERAANVLRLALWRLDAGGVVEPQLLVDAALTALQSHDIAVAARLARAGYQAAPSVDSGLVLAKALYEQGRFEESDRLVAEVAPMVRTETERTMVANDRAASLFWGLGDAERAYRVIEEVEESVTEPAAFWECRAGRAVYVSQSGDHRRALEILHDLPDPAPTSTARIHAALALGFSLAASGRGDAAIALIDSTIAMGDPERPLDTNEFGLLAAARVMACVGLGRLEEAAVVARAGIDAALAVDDIPGQAFFHSSLAWVLMNQGQLVEATRHYRDSSSKFRLQSHRGPLRWALGGLLFTAGLARDTEVAAEAERALDAIGDHPARMFESSILRGRAWAAVAMRSTDHARDLLREAVEFAERMEDRVAEALALHDLARLGEAREVVDGLVRLAEVCDGDLVATMAEHAAALVADDASRLVAVADRFEAMGFLLKAAEAAMGASDSAARNGDQRAASRYARTATELAQRCEAASTPKLVHAGGPNPLTDREREIALMAADGLSSKAIADRLFLSVRTVDNHLARIYSKLGVGGRADLAEAISRS